MAFELQTIVWTSIILLVLLAFQGLLIPLNQGVGWGLGSRDSKQEFSAIQGRAARTVANHIEGMLVFVPLILVVHIVELSSSLTLWGAALYLAGRIAFAFLYLGGVPVARSLAWAVSLTGIMLVGYEVVRAAL